MEPAKKLHPGITALIVIVLVGIAATATIVITSSMHNKTNTTDTTQSAQQDTTTTNTSQGSGVDSTATSAYKDGTYNATGSYSTPGGRESIELTVTIKNGTITSTSLVAKATDSDAKDYQAEFASAYKSLVVGKNVDRVSLSRVAGSSLTSNGFNSALDQIKTDAKA